MGTKKLEVVADYASEAEIEQAIEGLTATDTDRLNELARLRSAALRGLGLGIGPNDLLNEALRRTLAGKRRWRKDISFVLHLDGAMRSLASHATRGLEGITFVPADPNESREETGGASSSHLLAMLPDSDRIADARQQLGRIEKHFAKDENVLLLVEGLFAGMTGPEIQRDLSITEKTYEAAMLRLRRWARKNLQGEEPS